MEEKRGSGRGEVHDMTSERSSPNVREVNV